MIHTIMPTIDELADYIRVAHFRAFKRDLAMQTAQGIAHEIIVKHQMPPKYVCDMNSVAMCNNVVACSSPINCYLYIIRTSK